MLTDSTQSLLWRYERLDRSCLEGHEASKEWAGSGNDDLVGLTGHGGTAKQSSNIERVAGA